MEGHNNIFLFGAGSIIDWGGPTTSEMTDVIRSEGFSIKNSTQTLTDYIYQTLIKNGYDESEINFETIINVIEEFAIYFSEFNAKKQTPSLLKSFIPGDNLENIFDFAIKGGSRKHGYTLEIPEGTVYRYSKHALNDENPFQFYLQHLITEILSYIVGQISNYSYHTNGHSVIDTNTNNSLQFQKWMKQLQTEATLRLYTLNYDRVFKVLLDHAGIDCFEGFYPTGEVGDLEGLRCDLKRIIEDQNVNVHYNLHGSAFWKVLPTNSSQLPSPEIVFTGIPNLPINDDIANLQIEKGRPIYLTNIITGYQKVQRSLLSPFKQMQFSFERDCITSDKLHIIGYSFGDEHINQTLKTAFRYNKNLNIVIVDPAFIQKKLDHYLAINLFQYIEGDYILPRKVEDNKFSYFGGRVMVYTLKFSEYIRLMTGD